MPGATACDTAGVSLSGRLLTTPNAGFGSLAHGSNQTISMLSIFVNAPMPTLTDPLNALLSFQRALQSRAVAPRPGELDPSVLVYADQPTGELRLTYVRLEGQKVAALVNFTNNEPIESGVPCYGIGYAVHQNYRQQGRAKSLVDAAIAELRNGLGRSHIPAFHVEAIVAQVIRALHGIIPGAEAVARYPHD